MKRVRDKVKAAGYHKKWYEKNRAAQLVAFRKWYAENKEARKQSKDAWRKAHPANHRAYFHKRRDRLKSVEQTDAQDWSILQQLIQASPRLICGICGKNMPKNDRTIDHIIPLVRGGTGHIGNLRAVHRKCNSRKSVRLPHEFDGQHEMNFASSGRAAALTTVGKASHNVAYCANKLKPKHK